MNGGDCLEESDFRKARETLVLFSSGPLVGKNAGTACTTMSARFRFSNDLSPLFPYINAVADRSQLYEKPVYIKFVLDKRLCALYPWEGAFTPIGDMGQALEFLQKLFDFIQDISDRSESIVPSHKKFKPSSALDIFRLLPGSNCRDCGYPTCMAFAAALSRQYTSVVNCPHLGKPIEERATYPVYDQQGNVIRTVSITIDSGCLHHGVNAKKTEAELSQPKTASDARDNGARFDAANQALPAALSKREIEVLHLITRGATNREISAILRISQHTVKSHVVHIFNKIGVNDRVQASTWGVLNGVMNKI